MTEPLLTPKQVQEMLGISRGTLYAIRLRGELPHIQVAPLTVRFDPADVRAYIDRYRRSEG